MKRFTIVLVALLLFVTPAFAEMRIGYVDLQKALNLSKAGAEAKSEIAAQAKEYEIEFKIKEGEFLKLKGELEKQAALLSDSAKQEKLQVYQKSVADLQKFQQDAQRKLQQEDGKLTQVILKDLSVILETMGKEGKYSMILERSESGLVYIAEDINDLTDDLIASYDKDYKSK